MTTQSKVLKKLISQVDKSNKDFEVLLLQYEMNQQEVRNHYGVDKVSRKDRRSPQGRVVMKEFDKTMEALDKEFERRFMVMYANLVDSQIVVSHNDVIIPQLESVPDTLEPAPMPQFSPVSRGITPQVEFPINRKELEVIDGL